MEKNEKEYTDAYRQERKERIAKQAKSAEKKSNSHQSAKRVAEKIVSAVIAVVVIVALLGASLNFFGVPQRTLKAVTIDGKSYSMSELSCYYMMMYNNIASYASNYDSQYGAGYGKMLTGYDTSLSPADQTTKDDDGNEITWDEYFMQEAIENMANVKRYYNAALEAGVELTEEDEAEIQKSLDTIKSYTEGQNYSLSRYISLLYGKGVTTGLFKKILTEQQVVSVYQEQLQDELKGAYSDADVEKVYQKDKTAYDVVTLRWFTIDVESDKTAETASGEEEASDVERAPIAEELKAQEFIEKVKSQQNYNEETFKATVLEYVGEDDENYETYKNNAATLLQKIEKSAITSNVSEDAAKWLYEQDDSGNYVRQAGDMNYFLNSEKSVVYIFYATGTPFQDDTIPASVRHILVQYPTETTEAVSGEEATDTEETTVSAEVKSECESEAESILAQYKDYINENESGVADEEYFGELASKLSDDTGSQKNGGLISDLHNDGSYVENFEDWVFAEGQFADETRTAGDTAIVETEYGYHVMYYVGGHEHPEWYETILDNLISEDWEEKQTEFDENFAEDAIVRKEWASGRVKKSCIKMIERRG